LTGLPRLALLLAGGGSRRLGRDKALLAAGERALVQARVDALRREFPSCAVATDRRRALTVVGAAIWPDREPGAGPLPVLLDALERWDDALYLCAVDMPDPLSEAITALRAARLANPEAAAWLFEHEGILQPMGAIYSARLAPALREAFAAGERSLQRFLRAREDLCRLAGPDPMNLNRPQDAARWRGEADHV